MKLLHLITWLVLLNCKFIHGQFAPAAGQLGSQAIHTDSSVFIAWGQNCTVTRGPLTISDLSQGLASFGDSTAALGKADGLNVVSLGDGGSAIVTFNGSLFNGPGFDFAIFENGFTDDYLEFAFVEVSSDGQNYFRFPAISNIQDSIQTGPFDFSDPSKVHNLAGKYRALYGTPFDLNELSGINGLDLQNITHLKIIDVIGSITPGFQSLDSQGNIINDPWPSPFSSCGFDLDGVGLIHLNPASFQNNPMKETVLSIYPNPFTNEITLKTNQKGKIKISNFLGHNLIEVECNEEVGSELKLNLSAIQSGIYILEYSTHNSIAKKIIQKL